MKHAHFVNAHLLVDNLLPLIMWHLSVGKLAVKRGAVRNVRDSSCGCCTMYTDVDN